MKDFLKLIATFLLPVIVIAICTEVLLRKIPNDYSRKRSYLDKNSDSIRILVLGSSHAFYDVNPEYIGSQCFNAGYVSQTIDYDYEILKKYEGKWSSLKYIVLPVDYFTLFKRLATWNEPWRIKNYAIYCGINIGYDPKNNLEILSNRLKVNIGRLYECYVRHKSHIISTKLGWGTDNSFRGRLDLEATGKTGAQRAFATNDQNFHENVHLLTSIIEFGKERGIKVFLLTSPAYKTYVQNLDAGQLNRTINEARKMSDIYSNVTYVNLLNDSLFTANDFFDADHLNEFGAKKLTLKIDSLIKVK